MSIKRLSIAFTALFFMTGGLYAKYVITTGSKRGVYYQMGERLASQINAKVETSKGSVQNLNRLMSNQAQIGFSQKDVYRWYLSKHPSAESEINQLGTLGDECVFIVARKDGKVDDDSDLQEKGVKIAVGKTGSGSQVTWDYMSKLESNFKKAQAIPEGGALALSKVEDGLYDAALFVQSPNMNSWLFKTVAKDPKLKFIDVTDWDLNDKYKGQPVYTFKKIKTENGWFGGSKVKTICTQITLFANHHLKDEDADNIADILLRYKDYIISGAKPKE